MGRYPNWVVVMGGRCKVQSLILAGVYRQFALINRRFFASLVEYLPPTSIQITTSTESQLLLLGFFFTHLSETFFFLPAQSDLFDLRYHAFSCWTGCWPYWLWVDEYVDFFVPFSRPLFLGWDSLL